MPDSSLHLLEGADLDLANALARYAEFPGKLVERHPLFGEMARLERMLPPLQRPGSTRRGSSRRVRLLISTAATGVAMGVLNIESGAIALRAIAGSIAGH